MDKAGQDAWWNAVLSRDRSFDNAFVYGVRSTGIYCRPACPSRKPQRGQSIFFHLPSEARQAGFRPCRRCLPDEAINPDPHTELVQRLCRFIEDYDSPDRPLTLALMSEHMQTGPHQLQRVFKRLMGITPRQYAEACRLRRLKKLGKKGETVTRALYEAGFGSSSRLYEGALGRMGMTPAAYFRGGRGLQIRFTIVASPLGRLLVGATEKGVCAVSMGESDETLEAALRSEFPAASIRRDSGGLSEYADVLLRYLDGEQPDAHLPLDIRATAFQWKVYEALKGIPPGHTRTYGEIAGAVGSPKAARAVARACAANPAAIVIPCHRVIRKDGGLGGYRWGMTRKQILLAKEQEKAK